MKVSELEEIGGLFSELLCQKDSQGFAVLSGRQPDYKNLLVGELTKIERGSAELSEELMVLSLFIRRKLWNRNERDLYMLIHRINDVYSLISAAAGLDLFFDFEFVIEYINLLERYRCFYRGTCETLDYEKIIDKEILLHERKIIRKQWDDVLNGGMKTFIKVFDDVFNYAFDTYSKDFFISFSKTEIFSRCVKVKDCDESRFIPWPNKVHNRWNPPGKTFLYLAYKYQVIEGCPEELEGGEYICLKECRTAPDSDVCFCDFSTITEGKIFDLSYNDESLYNYRQMLNREEKDRFQSCLCILVNDPELINHRSDKKYVRDRIWSVIKNQSFSKRVLTVSIAKQYLKCICSCIYEKVDETNETEKERAYKSFHLLANYLEGKGVTGIVYPCTRIKGMPGKNIVLFNIDDATPIKGTIKQYHYVE